MKVEAVIICKDYSDFLEHTLPENLNHLDDIVVVTHTDDKKTQAVCNKFSIHFVTTDCFTEHGHTFNKGQAINVGLDHLHGSDWILHLDADIVLCRDFRRMLKQAQIRSENIYGADRVNVYGYEAWHELKPALGRHYQDRWFIDPGFCHADKVPSGIRHGARVLHKEYGYVPLGYFQLWHNSHGRRYNTRRGAAAGTDIMFPVQWPRENRVLLPDVVVYHLDSEVKHGIGTNWKGRKSKPFGPIERAIKHIIKEIEDIFCHICHRHHPPHYCPGNR